MPVSIDTTIASHIASVHPPARAWICDIWGVIHNGVEAFPAAVDACIRFRAQGGRIILVSNAPRPSDGVVAQLAGLGVPVTAYDAVLTSGDVTRAALQHWIGMPTLHIGPERDLTLFAGVDIPLVEEAEGYLVTFGPVNAPVAQWTANSPALTLAAGDLATLRSRLSGGSFLVRQIGTYAQSAPLLLTSLI